MTDENVIEVKGVGGAATALRLGRTGIGDEWEVSYSSGGGKIILHGDRGEIIAQLSRELNLMGPEFV